MDASDADGRRSAYGTCRRNALHHQDMSGNMSAVFLSFSGFEFVFCGCLEACLAFLLRQSNSLSEVREKNAPNRGLPAVSPDAEKKKATIFYSWSTASTPAPLLPGFAGL